MRSDPRGDEPLRIKDLLPDAGKRVGVKAPIETGVIWSRWKEIVGDAVAEHASPSSLRDGTLRVLVDAPAWATEIDYLGNEIAERANRLAGAEVVLEVRAWTSPEAANRVTERAREGSSRRAQEPVRPERAEDPAEALERARRAWLRSSPEGSREAAGRGPATPPENQEKGR